MKKQPNSKLDNQNKGGVTSRVAISNILRNSGIRPTPQRVSIYSFLKNTTSHPKAEAIYEAVKRDFPSLSLNTVYDTLRILAEANLIRRLVMKGNISRYDGNPVSHGHFVCVKCGRTDDLRQSVDEELEKTLLALRGKIDGHIIDHDYRFYGYCTKCANEKGRPGS